MLMRFFAAVLALCLATTAHSQHRDAVYLDNWRALEPGQELTFVLNGDVFLLRHRTEQEVMHARSVPLEDLASPYVWFYNLDVPGQATISNIPALDKNIGFGPDNRFVLLAFDCDHFTPFPIREAGIFAEHGGFFCMRLATHHDSAGRGFAKPGIGKAHNLATLPVEVVGDSLVVRYGHSAARDQAMRDALGWD